MSYKGSGNAFSWIRISPAFGATLQSGIRRGEEHCNLTGAMCQDVPPDRRRNKTGAPFGPLKAGRVLDGLVGALAT